MNMLASSKKVGVNAQRTLCWKATSVPGHVADLKSYPQISRLREVQL